jgi:toxin ParE1/3/4
MSRYFLTVRAREDIKSIGRYTSRTWGIQQSDDYLRKLHRRLALLARQPFSGASREDIGPEFRSASMGSHLIVYRCIRGGVEIVRVLHARMDIKSRMSGNQ